MKRRKRLIVVDDTPYKWLVTAGGDVVVWGPSGKQVIRAEESYGLTPDEVERGMWKKWFRVTPGHVAKMIRGERGIDYSNPPLEECRSRIETMFQMPWEEFRRQADAMVRELMAGKDVRQSLYLSPRGILK